MTRARVDQWCEKGILGVVSALLIYSPLAFGALRPVDQPVIQGLAVLCASLWLIRLWFGEARELVWPPVCWALVAFVLYAVLRYSQAPIEYVARQELLKVLCYAFLFLVVLNNVSGQESARIIVAVLLVLAVGLSIYAIYQYFTGSLKVWGRVKPADFRFRGNGTFANPNHLAGFLEVVLPVGLAYTLMGRMSHVARVLTGYASLMALAGIGVTVSRGGWLATGGALVIFFVVVVRMRGYRISAIVALALLLITSIVFIANADLSHFRFQSMFASGKIENIRFYYYGPTVQIWLDHFWLGGGPGHFEELFRQYRPEIVWARPVYAHNDYLNVLADWGLVGGVIVLAGWVLLGMGAWQTWRQLRAGSNELAARPSSRSALVLGASVGLVAILLHAFTDHNFYIPANAMVAVTLMALLAGHLRYVSSRYLFKAGIGVRIGLTLAVVAGIAFVGIKTVLRYHENRALAESERFPTDSPRMVEMLLRAHEIDPMNSETDFQLGESFRRRSWQALEDYQALAREGLEWFKRSIALNPYNSWDYVGAGMCLDWLDRFPEAGKYFDEALKRDPNGAYVVARVGWHYAQIGDFETARKYLERSRAITTVNNEFPAQYLEAVMRRLNEKAK